MRAAWLCVAFACAALGIVMPLPRYYALHEIDTRLEEHGAVETELREYREQLSRQGRLSPNERARLASERARLLYQREASLRVARQLLSREDEAFLRQKRAHVARRFWIHVGFGAAMCLIAVWIVARPYRKKAADRRRAELRQSPPPPGVEELPTFLRKDKGRGRVAGDGRSSA